MRWIAALAAIGLTPAVVWAITPKPKPIMRSIASASAAYDPNAVIIKPVRTIPIVKTNTLAERFETPPPTIPVRVASEDATPEPSAPVAVIPRIGAHGAKPERRTHSIRNDGICARHGMKKVHYGKRWRCRKV